jgi:hypothetical protein
MLMDAGKQSKAAKLREKIQSLIGKDVTEDGQEVADDDAPHR